MLGMMLALAVAGQVYVGENTPVAPEGHAWRAMETRVNRVPYYIEALVPDDSRMPPMFWVNGRRIEPTRQTVKHWDGKRWQFDHSWMIVLVQWQAAAHVVRTVHYGPEAAGSCYLTDGQVDLVSVN